MLFNPDPTKQAVEVIFSRKRTLNHIPDVIFNNNPVVRCESTKHLGLLLDNKLVFDQHIREKILKANKSINLITRLRKYLPRKSLLNIYKSFVRPILDYGDIIYDNPNNASLTRKLEKVQYDACLAITGCFRGTSREKLYEELGLESLADRRLLRRLYTFYKILNGLSPRYLLDYIPINNTSRNLRFKPSVCPIYARTNCFQNSFFPFCIDHWNKLDDNLRNLPTISSFKRAILNFIRPNPIQTFELNDNNGLILLTRLRVGFSHLREHKFRHGFLDLDDPFCSCRTNSIESTEHFLLHCPNFSNSRLILFDDLQKLNINIFPFSISSLSRLLLYGNSDFDIILNRKILEAVIKYINDSKRFSETLFH